MVSRQEFGMVDRGQIRQELVAQVGVWGSCLVQWENIRLSRQNSDNLIYI